MKTVDQGFREFQNKLTTPDHETAAARDHRVSVEACLKQNMGLEAFFQSGSFGNGTNIPLHSDVDRFAVFPSDVVQGSSIRALRMVQRALRQRFPTTAGIKIKPPSVVIPFGTEGREITEVIPAFHALNKAGEDVYWIPDPGGGNKWILSAPMMLRTYINEIDKAQNGRLKPLIRFLKVWKYRRKVPIQSIYLELTCTHFAHHMGLLSPSIDIARILHFVRSTKLPDMDDPLGIGQSIPAVVRTSLREDGMSKVRNAANMATHAVTAELEWNIRKAYSLWKLFFGPHFPKID